MATSKRHRKYSQDFSAAKHGRITDSSFAAACDVNRIVEHYAQTGVHPAPDRLAEYQRQCQINETLEAATMSYEDAMRNKAAYDSYLLENPPQALTGAPVPPAEPAPDREPVAKPAPQDATPGKSE